MTLRVAATVAVIVGIVGLFGYLHLLGKGPFVTLAARHLRAMKDRTESPATIAPATFAEFEALPHRLAVGEYSAFERRGVSLEGHVQHLLRAADGDLHLELAPTWRAPGAPDTAYVTGEISAAWRRGSAGWSYDALARAFRPSRGGATAWDGGTARVRLSGWLLYDFQYDDPPIAQAHPQAPRLTGWEIHPVTRIEVWDDARAAYVEVPR